MLPAHDLHATGMVTERTRSASMTSDSGVLVYASVMIDGKTKVNYRVYEGGLVEFAIGAGEYGPLTTEPGPHDLADRAQQALHAALNAALGAVARNDEDRPAD
jgi:hypothetical protein